MDESPQSTRLSVVPVAAIAGFVAFTVVVARVSGRLTDITGVIVGSALLAWLLHPIHLQLCRRIGGVGSIIALVIGSLSVALTVGGLLVRDLTSSADELARRLDDAFAGGDSRSVVAQLQRALRLGEGISEWLSSLPNTLVFGADGTPAVGQRVATIVFLVVLAAFFLASSSGLLSGLVALWPRPERERVWLLLGDVDRRAGGYLRGCIATGLLSGASLAVLGTLCGVPFAFVVGFWAGFWLIVPMIGWIVGTVPIVLLAISLDPGAFIAMLAGTLIVTTVALRMRISHDQNGLRPGVGVIVPCIAVGVAISGSASAILFILLGVIALTVATSEFVDVRLPTPLVDDDRSYRVGPLVLPHGLRGLVIAAIVMTTAVLVWTVAVRAASAFVWFTVAMLLAIALDRPIRFLARTLKIPRVWAVGLTFLVIGTVIAVLTVTVINEGPTSAARAVERLPRVIEDFERAPFVGRWLVEHDASTAVARELAELPSRLSRGQGSRTWFPSIGSQLVDVVWVMLLTLALSLDGARLASAAARRVPASKRRQFNRLIDVSHRSLAGYAAGAVLVSTMNGVVVLILALSLQLGLAAVLALWAFLWDFVPQIGGFIGGAPLLLFALIAGPASFFIAAIVYIVYQLIESNVIFPAIISETVDIPAWATMVAALVGAAAGGLVGAVMLTPLVGVVSMTVREYRRSDFPGRTASATESSSS